MYRKTWFEESGPARQIQFSIHKDQATIMLGYLRCAAAQARLSPGVHFGPHQGDAGSRYHRPGPCATGHRGDGSLLRLRHLPDRIGDARHEDRPRYAPPLCSGALGICAGGALDRDPEGGPRRYLPGLQVPRYGSDLDPEAAALSLDNAARPEWTARLRIQQADIADFTLPDFPAAVICNPPYGERLLEIKQAEELYRTMGRVFQPREGMSYYIISPHEEFEKLFGRPADKRPQALSGMIKCQLFMYFK